jgi:hypothetical protein
VGGAGRLAAGFDAHAACGPWRMTPLLAPDAFEAALRAIGPAAERHEP